MRASEGTNPCTRPSFATKNVFDVLQDLSESILSLHSMRRVGRERQLHLKVRALCGEVEKVFDVLVDTGAQVSLVKAGLLPPECLTDSRKPVSAEGGERPVHGGRHEGSGHRAAVREPS